MAVPVPVRRAVVTDAEAIAAVHVASWEGAYRGLVPEAWFEARPLSARVALWSEVLARGGSEAWVALGPDAPDAPVCGFCHLALPTRDEDGDEDTAEITSFYVDPVAWRGGIGRALMDAALADLERRGWTEVTLWVLEDNPRAQAFYVRCGFRSDGGRTRRESGDPWEIRLRRPV
jgi:ribosomal protein S18 acetylase RimI-like enzyme